MEVVIHKIKSYYEQPYCDVKNAIKSRYNIFLCSPPRILKVTLTCWVLPRVGVTRVIRERRNARY